ncbi:aspartic protease [Phlegmacium glaucopus]|nr:aspartic protease [Phlegmacium glaucopus]
MTPQLASLLNQKWLFIQTKAHEWRFEKVPRVFHVAVITLPISKRVNTTRLLNVLQRDQNRAKALKGTGQAETTGISLHNDAVINSQADNQATAYIASIGVGSPATTYDLVVDTGSSNTWIGAGKGYVRTSTSSQTSDSVAVRYGTGSFSGTEFIDRVTIAPGLVIPDQSIGVASTSSDFQGVDGILGIGPVGLTLKSLSPDTGSTIPTVTDKLFSAGVITAHEIGVSFKPITSSTGEQLNGEISWGGIDSSKFTGSITFAPITAATLAKKYWGIDQSILYGTTTILSSNPGIVDTGTTLTLIATDAFNRYQAATGAVIDRATGLLRITSAQFASLKNLSFIINGVSFQLTPNAQIWPRSLNTAIGGAASNIYLIIGDIGANSGSGLDFVNGQTFLERFYSVYDAANKRVGLATTPFTTATTN